MSAGEPGRTAGGVGLIFSGGELRATNPYGRLPGRPMGECYHIPERALGGFLMGHAHELDSSDVDLPRVFGIMAGRSRDNGENPRHRRGPAGAAQGLDPATGVAPGRKETALALGWAPAPSTKRR